MPRETVREWKQRCKELEREHNRLFDRWAFLQERVAALRQYLEAQEFWRKCRRRPFQPMTIADVQERLDHLLNATGDDVCLYNCKNLYFCAKKKGHRGKHEDESGIRW